MSSLKIERLILGYNSDKKHHQNTAIIPTSRARNQFVFRAPLKYSNPLSHIAAEP